MEIEKPKSIKTISTLIIIVSSLIIFSNSTGALGFSMLFDSIESSNNDYVYDNFGEYILTWILNHYFQFCLVFVLIGLLFLISGIFLNKYKNWAKNLTLFLSGTLIFSIWLLMIILSYTISSHEFLKYFIVGTVMTAIIFSTPFILLIIYLSKKKISEHFE